MIVFVLISGVAVAVHLCITALAIILSRAPESRQFRTLAAITFLLAMYALNDALILHLGKHIVWTEWAGRINVAIGLSVAPLLLIFSHQHAGKSRGRLTNLVIGIMVPAVPLCFVSDLIVDGLKVTQIPIFDAQVMSPRLTTLGEFELSVALLTMIMAGVSFIRDVYAGKTPHAWLYLLGLLLFLACAIEEALVSVDLLHFPYLGDLGFIGLLLTVSATMSSRFTNTTIAVAEANLRLEENVRIQSDDLVQAREALLIAERHAALGQLASGVGHEINNPLSYIAANLTYLRERFEATPDLGEEIEAVEEAIDGVDRIAKIVADLTVFAHSESNRTKICDPTRVIEVALRMVKAQNSTSLRFEVETRSCPNAAIDESRLTQVLVNLLSNAAHASSKGAGDTPLPVVIEAQEADEGETLRITIRDQGCGIEREILDRIFDPLFTTKDVGEGTGLGLFVCKGIIDSAGGSLQVESTPGIGTAVTLLVPGTSRKLSSLPAKLPETTKPEIALSAPESPPKIYIIDDEKQVTRALARLLRKMRVVCENDSRRALEHLQGPVQYDVIICDLMMPQLSGMNLYRQISRSSPDIAARFLFISGGAIGSEAERFVKNTEIRLLPKPLDRHELLQSIRAIAETQAQI